MSLSSKADIIFVECKYEDDITSIKLDTDKKTVLWDGGERKYLENNQGDIMWKSDYSEFGIIINYSINRISLKFSVRINDKLSSVSDCKMLDNKF